MPVNMPTHGHGQGYTDLNFLIPELVAAHRSARAPTSPTRATSRRPARPHIDYSTALDASFAQSTLGIFGYRRAAGGAVAPVGARQAARRARAACTTTDRGTCPTPAQDQRRAALQPGHRAQRLQRHRHGLHATAGPRPTRSPSARSITGLIGRFGSLDPTDGGNSQRYSLSGRVARERRGRSRASSRPTPSATELDLFNNFTYFLDDPANGDQFRQTDEPHASSASTPTTRSTAGWRRSTARPRRRAGAATTTSRVGLFNTVSARSLSTVRDDDVRETQPRRLRPEHHRAGRRGCATIVGVRGDCYRGVVDERHCRQLRHAGDCIASPKLSLVFGPVRQDRTLLQRRPRLPQQRRARRHHHRRSDDRASRPTRCRCWCGPRAPKSACAPRPPGPAKHRSRCSCSTTTPSCLFVGDAGTTEPSRPSRRVGVEWTNHYKPLPWLGFDLDVAFTRARFTDVDPAGDHIPGLADLVVSAGVAVGKATGWFGAAQAALLRPAAADRRRQRALVTDHAGQRARRLPFRERYPATARRLQPVQRQGEPDRVLLRSRLASEPSGVATFDRHLHPVEPLAIRLTLAGPL